MTNTFPDTDDVVRKAKEIYVAKLRDLLEPEHNGEYLVIDVNSGEYEVGQDRKTVLKRIHERLPEGRFLGVCVGFHPVGVLRTALNRKQQS
jgi:hypothetical protein